MRAVEMFIIIHDCRFQDRAKRRPVSSAEDEVLVWVSRTKLQRNIAIYVEEDNGWVLPSCARLQRLTALRTMEVGFWYLGQGCKEIWLAALSTKNGGFESPVQGNLVNCADDDEGWIRALRKRQYVLLIRLR
ncbi:hypothetical protein NPIL_404051 [Nephila pilipes]|uniref:Uncharacterized protein n=1 Tax=Nephila pilipes TaxID=299642 RepID=A0A8X6U4I9_NEPPI|nr:hypothetical protein NPIL_404051 [Nephila pilipes]